MADESNADVLEACRRQDSLPIPPLEPKAARYRSVNSLRVRDLRGSTLLLDVRVRIRTDRTDTVGRRDGGSVERSQTGGVMGTITWGEVPGTLHRVPVRVRLTRTGSKPAI
mgnify:CR=1 FL=1